jgi:hypothetical protein
MPDRHVAGALGDGAGWPGRDAPIHASSASHSDAEAMRMEKTSMGDAKRFLRERWAVVFVGCTRRFRRSSPAEVMNDDDEPTRA